jgi:hypothetical protein
MEARHDLGKFITELAVAERGAVLSSGRELQAPRYPVRKIAQGGETTTTSPLVVVPVVRRGHGSPENRISGSNRSTN